MDPLGEGAVHQAMPGENGPRGPNIRGSLTGNRPTSNERPTQDTHATGTSNSRNRSHANQGRSHPSDSDRRENQSPYQGAMILKRGIQEKLHQKPQPLNL